MPSFWDYLSLGLALHFGIVELESHHLAIELDDQRSLVSMQMMIRSFVLGVYFPFTNCGASVHNRTSDSVPSQKRPREP
jgi:hypothetical protein